MHGVLARPAWQLLVHTEAVTHTVARGDGRFFIDHAKDSTVRVSDLHHMTSEDASTERNAPSRSAASEHVVGPNRWPRVSQGL